VHSDTHTHTHTHTRVVLVYIQFSFSYFDPMLFVAFVVFHIFSSVISQQIGCEAPKMTYILSNGT